MKINNIVNKINRKLAGELLSYYELKDYLDDTIDDINEKLGSTYPAFSELDPSTDEYNFFPDKFIRRVIVFGAAWYYFIADEEGISSAIAYEQLYLNNLLEMQRDYVSQVPEEYQKGYVDPETLEGDAEAPEATYGTLGDDPNGVIINGTTWSI